MHLRSGHCMPMATLPLGGLVHLKDDHLIVFA
jgi:muramoyltetrapeptide carboxypeptidase LdcA involved in peptidoglycan recycling